MSDSSSCSEPRCVSRWQPRYRAGFSNRGTPLKGLLLPLLAASAVIVGCSGGSSGDGTVGTPSTTVLRDTRVATGGQVGLFVEAPPPATSNSLRRPEAFSTPDVALLNDEGLARVELAYRTSSALTEAFLSADGESGHIELELPDESSSEDAAGESLIIELTRTGSRDQLQCLLIRVRDGTGLVSEDSTICTVMAEPDTRAERLIYLSSFDDDSVLSTLSLDSGEVMRIGTAGVQLTDIAFLDGTLYGISLSELFRIDLESARASTIGRLGVSDANALEAFDDVLYSATLGGQFVRVNPQTAETTVVASLPTGTASSGDLVRVEGSDTLYGTLTLDGAASDLLVEIDVADGTTRLVGETGYANIWGLGIAREQLLGLTTDGEYLLIDPATAESVLVERTSALSASGASLAP